jgi:hypothetical protein
MAPSAATQPCDHHACPASAQRTYLIYGQDFHFCGHHSTEVQRALVANAVPWAVIIADDAGTRSPLPRRVDPPLPPQRIRQER